MGRIQDGPCSREGVHWWERERYFPFHADWACESQDYIEVLLGHKLFSFKNDKLDSDDLKSKGEGGVFKPPWIQPCGMRPLFHFQVGMATLYRAGSRGGGGGGGCRGCAHLHFGRYINTPPPPPPFFDLAILFYRGCNLQEPPRFLKFLDTKLQNVCQV